MIKQATTSEEHIPWQKIRPGTINQFEIPVARMPTQGYVHLPVMVVKGASEGPCIWLSAAIHGDEINGIEIIHRIRNQVDPKLLAGTIIACPVVNVYGFLYQSRYLPDRRDLNRSFPGTGKGSLAGRLANFFMREVVARCDLGIDLHTAAENNDNLPQIRADLRGAETRELAQAFGAPVAVHSGMRDGSLRHAAAQKGVRTLVYEAGEAQRFSESAITTGTRGIWRLLGALNMYPDVTLEEVSTRTLWGTSWMRSSASGIFHPTVDLGQEVAKGELIATLADSFGATTKKIKASRDGLVIGIRRNPLVYRGDAVMNLGHQDKPKK